MFVRGGVYRVVKEAMGNAGKILRLALMFDYILTAHQWCIRWTLRCRIT